MYTSPSVENYRLQLSRGAAKHERSNPCLPAGSLRPPTTTTVGQSPGFRADDLSFAIGPEIHQKANKVVNGGVGALVNEGSGQGGEREEGQAELEASMNGGPGEQG